MTVVFSSFPLDFHTGQSSFSTMSSLYIGLPKPSPSTVRRSRSKHPYVLRIGLCIRTPVILLQAIECADVSTLLNLCLTGKAIHLLIFSYEASIKYRSRQTLLSQSNHFDSRQREQHVQITEYRTIKQPIQLPRRDVARELSVLCCSK